MPPPVKTVSNYLQQLQTSLKNNLGTISPELQWRNDAWHHSQGAGGGLTCIGKDAHILEQAGVNFSHISHDKMIDSATVARPDLKDAAFEATGLSVIIHPHNPYVPTTHANFRYFEATQPSGETVWWFGGGFDLTPYYPFEEDCIAWHQAAYTACAPFGKEIYPEFKAWCDRYFYLKHRQEPRGIGGLFFDDLNRWDFDTCFRFIQAASEAFVSTYTQMLTQRHSTPYGAREVDFQRYRRGRYVEFNLLYDRGTQFGLASNGRTESILASLPPVVHWQYNRIIAPDSEETKLAGFLSQKDWISLTEPALYH